MSLFDLLPDHHGDEREQRLLDHVLTYGFDPVSWTRVQAGPVVFEVMNDALKIEGVRINATHPTAQLLLDVLDAVLPTARMVDFAYHAATKHIEPCYTPDFTIMATTRAMKEHSATVDKALAKVKCSPNDLVTNVGKWWITDNRLGEVHNVKGQPGYDPELPSSPHISVNYGWFSRTGPNRSVTGLPIWQSVGAQHNDKHVDRSQVVRGVRNVCLVNGDTTALLTDLWKDPVFADHLCHAGVLQFDRHPLAPPFARVEGVAG